MYNNLFRSDILVIMLHDFNICKIDSLMIMFEAPMTNETQKRC